MICGGQVECSGYLKSIGAVIGFWTGLGRGKVMVQIQAGTQVRKPFA